MTDAEYEALKKAKNEMYMAGFSSMTPDDCNQHVLELTNIKTKIFEYEKAIDQAGTDQQ